MSALANPHQDLPTIPTVLPSLSWMQDVLKEFTMDLSSSSSSSGLSNFINALREQLDKLASEVKKCTIYSIASALGKSSIVFNATHPMTEQQTNFL